MSIFNLVYNAQKLFLLSFITMETSNNSNEIEQGNSELRDSSESMIPGVFDGKMLMNRKFSFSYEESLSLGGANLSHNLSLIFSSSENRQRSKSSGKYKKLFILFIIFFYLSKEMEEKRINLKKFIKAYTSQITDELLKEKDELLKEKDELLKEKDELNERLKEKDEEIARLKKENEEFKKRSSDNK